MSAISYLDSVFKWADIIQFEGSKADRALMSAKDLMSKANYFYRYFDGRNDRLSKQFSALSKYIFYAESHVRRGEGDKISRKIQGLVLEMKRGVSRNNDARAIRALDAAANRRHRQEMAKDADERGILHDVLREALKADLPERG